jgi:outer membrane protein assembly factor BamB
MDRKTGGLIWYVNVMADFQAQNIEWGFTSSPVIEGDILLVNACAHGIALNKNTGKKIWISYPGKCGYATPVVFQMGAKKFVAIFSEKSIIGVELETGKKKWSYYWETDYDINAADPIFVENKIFISSGYGCGCALIDISGKKPKKVWRNRKMSNHFGSSILIDGYIYGPNGNTGERSSSLNCISLETGELMWSQNLGFNSIIACNGKLISLNEQGELIICLAQKEAYKELARARVLSADRSKVCWTSPVLSNGMIYCRNSVGDLVCVDVR